MVEEGRGKDTVIENLITLKEMTAELEKFRLPSPAPEHRVRRTLDGLMILPVHVGPGRGTNMGRVQYYEKLCTWVVATALHASGAAAKNLRNRAQQESAMFRLLGAGPAEAERLWYYAFITNPKHAIDLPVLERIVIEHPELLNLTSDGEHVLRQALRIHKAQALEVLTGKPVELDDVEFPENPKTRRQRLVDDRHFPELMQLLQEQGVAASTFDPHAHRIQFGKAPIHLGW